MAPALPQTHVTMSIPPEMKVFGIRHHGPGSARALVSALESWAPDVVLVEGPPDAAALLPLVAHAAMRPPVALLVYRPDVPQEAVYYPFALFSPEWQALRYGVERDIPVRMMDLPQAHRFALAPTAAGQATTNPDRVPAEPAAEKEMPGAAPDGETASETEAGVAEPNLRVDPLRWLAAAAGYTDSERWWEQMVEQRRDGTELFTAILEAMSALRSAAPGEPDPGRARVEALREAWMRQTIRAASREGFRRIAVVCGAWHAPALVDQPARAVDAALLRGLPRVKVAATWVPWTHGRLQFAGGYGAGIESPGWYHHLWSCPEDTTIRWLTRVARLLREKDLSVSAAHVIESARLAEALAALNGRPDPGLPELNDAVQSVLLFGDPVPMALIHERLIVGEELGSVPDDAPMPPLQADLQKEQKRLRLKPEVIVRPLELDLRKPNDLDRSRLLHRLLLLEIRWGRLEHTGGGASTFHENWKLRWEPEFAVSVIEAGIWGNTVASSASARVRERTGRITTLSELTSLAGQALLADLPDAVAALMDRLRAEAALLGDAEQMMAALPPLARVTRYGNVRRTDRDAVAAVIDGLVPRLCINLSAACASLDDEAAAGMLQAIEGADHALALLEAPAYRALWHEALRRLVANGGIHGLVAGRACRILMDAGGLEPGEAARRLSLALSTAVEPARAAAWVEGLLRGSGLLLLHDETLWSVLDDWVTALPADSFQVTLPLLRRTFSQFPAPERRQMGERVRRGVPGGTAAAEGPVDRERADRVLSTVALLLGVPLPGAPTAAPDAPGAAAGRESRPESRSHERIAKTPTESDGYPTGE